MEFITVEQFKEQPIEVQEVFLDWWKPSEGDVYCNLYNNQQDKFLIINKCQLEMFKTFKEDIKLFGIPLLLEGQLRRFVEDKTECKIEIVVGVRGYCFVLRFKDSIKEKDRISIITNDLLQAYWKVACSVAKESAYSDR